MDPRLELKVKVWERLNTEVLQYMRMLDFWIMFLIALVVFLIVLSRQPGYSDLIVWAAVAAAVAPVWIGRMDVLIHRPVPATIAVEQEIEDSLQIEGGQESLEALREPQFRAWENYYKPQLKTGVKVLVPLDMIALLFLLLLFVHANSGAATFLSDTAWSSMANTFWWACWVVFVSGVGIIAAAKKLAE